MCRNSQFGTSGVFTALVVGIFSSCLQLAAEEIKLDKSKTKAKKVSLEPAKKPIEMPAPNNGISGALLKWHNDVRARNGLAPFKLHPKLTAAAQRYAEYSFRTRSFGHRADGRSPAERISAEGLAFGSWAENMALGQETTLEAMNTWLRSTGHRKNILSSHTHVGFGRVGGVWVAVFANPVEPEDGPELARK